MPRTRMGQMFNFMDCESGGIHVFAEEELPIVHVQLVEILRIVGDVQESDLSLVTSGEFNHRKAEVPAWRRGCSGSGRNKDSRKSSKGC
jgi:hypothetical protein